MSLFILEIFMFLYYGNEECDGVIKLMVSFKQLSTESRISPEILEQCSSNLAPEMNITKETE